ncbi:MULTISPECIES: DUF6429 family protein [unclassified Bradyrhizobium]|uniref:DUF6429 family protein n=1 Tax=unclassified Bradyrhizobium TaxID=2631580 RepID=UPI0032E49660
MYAVGLSGPGGKEGDRGIDCCRTWKGFDWDTLERLHQKGLDRKSRQQTKSVFLTDEVATR